MAATVLLLGGCGSSGYSSGSAQIAANAAATGSAPSSSAYGSRAPSSAYGAGAATDSSGGTSVTVVTKQAKMGTVLAAGPKRLTVYLFEADKGSNSACSGACTAVWPPVRSAAAAVAGGQAAAAALGTTKRPDGTTQVTYGGHPLYFYLKDKDAGDAYGQGVNSFGAGWYVLAPSGSKIDSQGKGGGSGS